VFLAWYCFIKFAKVCFLAERGKEKSGEAKGTKAERKDEDLIAALSYVA